MGPIGKLHNIVVHIRSSSIHMAKFSAEAGQLIPLDNRTRWNSWYAMISAALNLKKELNRFVKNQPDLKQDTLSPQDWEWLRMIEQFLGFIEDVALENEGEQRDISNTLPTLAILNWHIKATKQKIQKGKVGIIKILITIGDILILPSR
jgi:methionine synthase II (cobalamin-independent)